MENVLMGKISFNPTRRSFVKAGGILGVTAVGSLGMESCNANQWIQTAISDLPAALQVISSIVGIVAAAQGGAITAQLQNTLNAGAAQVTKALQTALNLINGYSANPDKGTALKDIDAALVDAQTNLTDILAVFHVSDPVLQSTISAALGLAIATVIGIQAVIPPPLSPSTTTRVSLAKANGANAIKEAFNVIVGKSYPAKVIPLS